MRAAVSQERLYRSTKLWTFYVDLEESLGTMESTKACYDQIIDLRIATPQIILNYAVFLQESKYWEDSFKVPPAFAPSHWQLEFGATATYRILACV